MPRWKTTWAWTALVGLVLFLAALFVIDIGWRLGIISLSWG